MGLAIHASDRRRGKWDSFKQGNEIQLLLLAKSEPERPKAKYKVGETVKTPMGYRRIDGLCFMTKTGWHYRFYTDNCMYKESEIEPSLSLGDMLLMKDIARIIGAAG